MFSTGLRKVRTCCLVPKKLQNTGPKNHDSVQNTKKLLA